MLCPAVGLEHSKKVRELLYRRILRAWGHNTKLEKIVFGTHISVPDNGLIIIPANGIAVGMALAINGDYEADDSFYVVGVWTDNNIIKVKLSKNDIGSQVRINYVYVKS